MERIVVGMDGSARAAEALRWAVEEGRTRKLPVAAVLVWSLLDQHHVGVDDVFDADYGDEDALVALDSFVTDAVGPESAEDVLRSVVCERPGPGLIDAARGASLLVLGPRGFGAFQGMLLGSVSRYCLQHAHCPVAVVRDGNEGGTDVPRRIVVAVDGSPASRRAVDWALDEARARTCILEVVHAWMPPYAYGYPTPIPIDAAAVEAGARQMVTDLMADVDLSGLAHPVEPVVIAAGSPVGALLAHAEGADLVVVGTRGVGGFRGMLLGSFAHHVAQHGTGTAVIIPPASAT